MARLRNFKGLVFLFIAVLVFSFCTALITSEPAKASRCECWVMMCTIDAPVYCWEVCVPCPPLWP